MFLAILQTLFFGILISNVLLPASAKNEFPRTHRRDKTSASLLSSLLIPYKKTQRASTFEIRPFRKSGKTIIIALEPESSVVKNLKKLPLEKIYDDNELKNSFESLETLQYEKLYENVLKPTLDSSETNYLNRYLAPKFKPIGIQPAEVLQIELFDGNARIKPKHDSSETKSIETWPLYKLYNQNGRQKPALDSIETKKEKVNSNPQPKPRFTPSEANILDKLEKFITKNVANAKYELPETKIVDLSGKFYDKKVPEARNHSFEEKNLKMALDKLFDDNGMLYLSKPKEKRLKKMLRQNEDLVEKLGKKPRSIGNSKTAFYFSDLVL